MKSQGKLSSSMISIIAVVSTLYVWIYFHSGSLYFYFGYVFFSLQLLTVKFTAIYEILRCMSLLSADVRQDQMPCLANPYLKGDSRWHQNITGSFPAHADPASKAPENPPGSFK